MYTTTENIENVLGTELSAEQAAYFTNVLSPAIVSYIDNVTNTSFANVSATVYVNGSGISLMSIPTMNTITAVLDEGGNTVPTTEYSAYPQSAVEKIALRHKSGVWEEGAENYTIVGKLGHSTVPSDIVHVATTIAVNALTSDHSGYKSEKTGDWSATYADVEKQLSPANIDILKSYDRISRRI